MQSSSGSASRGVRPAVEDDVDAIHTLVDPLSVRAILLPRTTEKIREDLPCTVVYHNQGQIIGVGNTVDYGEGLFEIRGLAVRPDFQGLGVGRAIVEALVSALQEKHSRRPLKVFALTYVSSFFVHLGWTITEKHNFPQKIFKDCEYCPRKLDCPETAVELVV